VNREWVSAASSTSRVFSLAPALAVAPTPVAVGLGWFLGCGGAVWIAMVLNL
jgi:hypothetical protein